MKKYLTQRPSQTKKLGEILAREIIRVNSFSNSRKFAKVLGLEGNLGSGKTTFLQGFAKGLGIKQKILSPTFVILKKFQVPSSKFKVFYHIDCYRINQPREILKLGFKEIISNPENIVAVEWANHIRKILPKDTLRIKFEFINKNKRKIYISC